MPLTKLHQKLVRLIRELHRKRQPLNIAAIKRSHPHLLRRVFAVKPFWGWKQALKDAGIDYGKINVELQEYVTCRVCGKDRGFLNGHLFMIHKITAAEYLEQYPGEELLSEEVRARKSVSLKRHTSMPHWEPLWSAEYILDRIAEMHRRGMQLNSGWIQKNEEQLLAAAQKYIGSWDEALGQVGIDPQEVRLADVKSDFTKAEVIARLKDRAKHKLPLNHAAIQHDDLQLFGAIRRRFPDFDSALRAAGFDPSTVRLVPQKYGEVAAQRLLQRVREAAILPDIDRKRVWKRIQKQFHGPVKTRRFGSWNKVLVEAGVRRSLFPIQAFDPENHVNVRFPTPQSVIKEFKRRLREGLPIHSKGVFAEDRGLYKAAVKYFGKYSTLCRTLKFPARQPRVMRYPNKQSVVGALQARLDAGLEISSNSIAESDGALANAIRKHFGRHSSLYRIFGKPARKRRKQRYPDKPAVIRALRERIIQGQRITSYALHKENSALNEAVRRFFGSFDTMYAELGVPKPKRSRKGLAKVYPK